MDLTLANVVGNWNEGASNTGASSGLARIISTVVSEVKIGRDDKAWHVAQAETAPPKLPASFTQFELSLPQVQPEGQRVHLSALNEEVFPPVQEYPVSTAQRELQPSPSITLPSSQASTLRESVDGAQRSSSQQYFATPGSGSPKTESWQFTLQLLRPRQLDRMADETSKPA